MQKLLIHAGFHKTATSTVQTFFVQNRALLHELVDFRRGPNFKEAQKSALRYSDDRGNHLKLANFQDSFARYVEDIIGGSAPTIFVSSETLSGHLPGRPKVRDYSAAVDLAVAMEQVLTRAFGVQDLSFYYSLRQGDDWLESAYAEQVKSSSLMTITRENFIAQNQIAKDFASILVLLRENLTAKIASRDIAEFESMPFGPVTPLLDLLDIPESMRRICQMPEKQNIRQPDEISAAMLEVNRLSLDPKTKFAMKASIMGRERERD